MYHVRTLCCSQTSGRCSGIWTVVWRKEKHCPSTHCHQQDETIQRILGNRLAPVASRRANYDATVCPFDYYYYYYIYTYIQTHIIYTLKQDLCVECCICIYVGLSRAYITHCFILSPPRRAIPTTITSTIGRRRYIQTP